MRCVSRGQRITNESADTWHALDAYLVRPDTLLINLSAFFFAAFHGFFIFRTAALVLLDRGIVRVRRHRALRGFGERAGGQLSSVEGHLQLHSTPAPAVDIITR
eukprot:3460240-Rhodomonas_salina.1